MSGMPTDPGYGSGEESPPALERTPTMLARTRKTSVHVDLVNRRVAAYSVSSPDQKGSSLRRGSFGSVGSASVMKIEKQPENVTDVLFHLASPSATASLLSNRIYTTVLVVATTFAVVGDDVLLLGLPKAADTPWGILTGIVLLCFTVDIILHIIAMGKKYLFSLYCALDILATGSLIISMLAHFHIWGEELVFGGGVAVTSVAVVRLGRIARVSARAGRLMRFLKLFDTCTRSGNSRHMQQVAWQKILKSMDANRDNEIDWAEFSGYLKQNDTIKWDLDEAKEVFNILDTDKSGVITKTELEQFYTDNIVAGGGFFNKGRRASHVGHKLSELTTRKVIVGVFLMFFIPLLFGVIRDLEDPPDSRSMGLEVLVASTSQRTLETPEAKHGIAHYRTEFKDDLLYLELYGKVILDDTKKRKEVREALQSLYDKQGGKGKAIFNESRRMWLNSLLNMVETLWLLFVLFVGNYFLLRDADRLLVAPVEKMLRVVEAFQTNPLSSLDNPGFLQAQPQSTSTETGFLVEMVKKMARMLQVSVGLAGAEIIARNLSSRGKLEVVIPGVKVWGIYGFVDIKSFTNITEILQEDITVFLNTIAYYVHQAVIRHDGHPNKNIGDAFLVVWREDPEIPGHAEDLVRKAIAAMVHVINNVDTSPVLLGLAKRVNFSRFRIGCGLHYGWSIEGAVGSESKIDATYISPDVNMSSRLEAATRWYDIALLMSNIFYDLLPTQYQEACRPVDKVLLKGVAHPIQMYTYNPVRMLSLVTSTHTVFKLKKSVRVAIQNAANHVLGAGLYTAAHPTIPKGSALDPNSDFTMSDSMSPGARSPASIAPPVSAMKKGTGLKLDTGSDTSSLPGQIEDSSAIPIPKCQTCEDINETATEILDDVGSVIDIPTTSTNDRLKRERSVTPPPDVEDDSNRQPTPTVNNDNVNEEGVKVNNTTSGDLGASTTSSTHDEGGEAEGASRKEGRKTLFDISQGVLRYDTYQQGFDAYIQGDWLLARKYFKQFKEVRQNDTITDFLLQYIAGYNNCAPEDWPGYRVVDQK